MRKYWLPALMAVGNLLEPLAIIIELLSPPVADPRTAVHPGTPSNKGFQVSFDTKACGSHDYRSDIAAR